MNGKRAVVLGRSDIVVCNIKHWSSYPKSKDCYYQGAPVATLLTGENATVTLCHSKTENIESIVCMLLSCR